MGIFARLRERLLGERPPPPPPPPVAEAPVDLRGSIVASIQAGRFDQAMAALRSARGGPDEHLVVDALTFALTRGVEAPELLRLELADVLVTRGDRRGAHDQLAEVRSPAAAVLRGDLLCEGLDDGVATAADLDRALALYTEALAGDVDAPGVRERFERLRTRLGGGRDAAQPSFPTLLAPGGALPFTLVREVARGGAGVVYEAREDLGAAGVRTVALKMIHDKLRGRDALLAEARAAIRFRGAGVIAIHDLDLDEGWLSMAWMSGGSLRGSLTAPRDFRAVLASLLKTLADVHAAGWVHGDVKPANVLFDEDDAPTLGDFGLARPIGSPATPGTPGYVSAARAGGALASPRDDVHGVGCIARDLLEAGQTDPVLTKVRDLALAEDEAPPDAAALLDALGWRTLSPR
ncbi:MAG: protein kinase [Myxococcales bacterium]|nr:protein kinase [Myxococcales bacterium]